MALSTSYQEVATSPNYSAVRVGLKYKYISGKTVRIYMGLYVNSSYSGGYGSDYCTAKINGSTIRGDGSWSGGSYRVYGVGWTDIGYKDITISSGGSGGSAATNVTWSIWSYHFQSTPSGTVTVPAGAVPSSQYDAASSLTLSATSVAIGGSVTFTASNSVYSGYTHYFYVYVGGTNRKTLSRSNTGSVTFSPDYATFAPLNTTGTSMTATVYLNTYRGSTYIGQTSKTLTITIPNNSTTKPTVSMTVTLAKQFQPDQSHTYNISGVTTANVSISATPKYSTTIASYSETFDGASIGTAASITNKILSSSSSGSKSLVGTATDKRGFSNSASQSIAMTAYARPSYVSIVSKRCGFNKPLSSIIYTNTWPVSGADTSKIYILNGDETNAPKAYEYDGTQWAEVTPTVKNDGEFLMPYTIEKRVTDIDSFNPAIMTVRWKKKSETEYGPEMPIYENVYWIDTGRAGLNPEGLSPNYTYDIQYLIQDEVGAQLGLSKNSVLDMISTAFTLMDFAKYGKSMAIGRISDAESLGESSALEVGMPSYFYNGIFGKQHENDANWIDILGELIVTDITADCTLQNSWAQYDSGADRFRVYKIGNSMLLYTGILKAGTIGTNVRILKLPDYIHPGSSKGYHYGFARTLSASAQVRWLPIRNGYLQQDNNAGVDATAGTLVVLFGLIPLI